MYDIMSGSTCGDRCVHRASSDDVEAIAALINAHARSVYGEDRVSLDEVRSWFSAPGVEQDDTRSWRVRDGSLMAYAQVYWPEFPSTWDVIEDVTVHPDFSGDEGLWDDIFAWCDRFRWSVQRTPRASGGDLTCGARVQENDSHKRRQYESRGFNHVRTETLMRIGLDETVPWQPQWPEGIRVREFDLTKDAEGYALAYGEAFRDHWGHVDIPLDEQVRRKRTEFEAWGEMYVPGLWLVALEGDTIVGSVGGFLNYGNTAGRCYMYHVFVRRAWRNRRIATALLRTEFNALRQLGGRTVELHVDSENMTYGLELYRGLGMRPVWNQFSYETKVPASSGPPSPVSSR